MINKITKTREKGIALIKGFERFMPKAYLCPAGIWTIGYGTRRYPDGTRVKTGDKATMAQATSWMQYDLKAREKGVDDCTRDDVTQHEFDAIMSFVYNAGVTAFATSGLNKMINMRTTNAETLIKEFCRWNKRHVNGRLVETDGLTRRRKSEAHLYLTGELNFFE